MYTINFLIHCVIIAHPYLLTIFKLRHEESINMFSFFFGKSINRQYSGQGVQLVACLFTNFNNMRVKSKPVVSVGTLSLPAFVVSYFFI